MPCSSNDALVVYKTYNNSSSSACIDNIITKTVNFNNSSALMLGSSKTDSNVIIDNGYLKSPYIFLSTRCDFNFGEAKLSGKVFLVNPEDFNSIYWTWTNKGMIEYITTHNLVGIDYNYETIDSHLQTLVSASGNTQNTEHFDDNHYNDAFYDTVSGMAESTNFYRDKYYKTAQEFEAYKQQVAKQTQSGGGSNVPHVNPQPYDFPAHPSDAPQAGHNIHLGEAANDDSFAGIGIDYYHG